MDLGWFSLFVLLGLLIASFAVKPLGVSLAGSVLIVSRSASVTRFASTTSWAR